MAPCTGGALHRPTSSIRAHLSRAASCNRRCQHETCQPPHTSCNPHPPRKPQGALLEGEKGDMLLAPAVGAALLYRQLTQTKRQAARRRELWLDGSGGAAAASAAAATAACLVDWDSLDPSSPERFYLTDASLEQLSDCYAVLEGARLPLHAQLLSAQAGVLRQLFIAAAEVQGGGCGSTRAPLDITAAFGCGLREAACFLRLIYSPDHATPASLRALHECPDAAAAAPCLLAAVAGLAHRLDAAALLHKLEAYLQGEWQLLQARPSCLEAV